MVQGPLSSVAALAEPLAVRYPGSRRAPGYRELKCRFKLRFPSLSKKHCDWQYKTWCFSRMVQMGKYCQSPRHGKSVRQSKTIAMTQSGKPAGQSTATTGGWA
eukprot:531934-Rhodomonas_salina.1